MHDLLEAPKTKKTLRPHQSRAIDQLRSSIGIGNKRIVLQGPTGFGKTLVAAKIIESAQAKGNQVLFTVPRISLIDQTISSFENEGIYSIGVHQGNHPRRHDTAMIQIASLQTLRSRLKGLDLNPGLVIIDEAHERDQVVDEMMSLWPNVPFIGMTATPWRVGMGKQWQDLIIPVTIGDLIEYGYLSKFTTYAPSIPDLSGVSVSKGEYAEAQLEEVMGGAAIIGGVVPTWLEKASNRPTLCFGVNRSHARTLSEQFLRAGVAAVYVDHKTDRAERAMIDRKFRSGEIKVACSVRTMTTGVDLPVSCIVDCAPTRSEMLHVQKIGRGLRINPGTEDLLILDHAGNSIRLGLVTDIHHDHLDDGTPKPKAEPTGEKREKLPKPCAECDVLFTGIECPCCGAERKIGHGVEAAEGELVQISGKIKKPTSEEKQRFWSMALWVDCDRQKGGRLAKALYKSKFGVWPRGLMDRAIRPDPIFWNYEKSRRIAFAKRMEKTREVAA